MTLFLTGVVTVIAVLAFLAACGAYHQGKQNEIRVRAMALRLTELDQRLTLQAQGLITLASAVGDLATILKAKGIEWTARGISSRVSRQTSGKVH